MFHKVWVVAGIILVAIILNFALYLHFGYAFGGDQDLTVPTLSSLYNSFFSWAFYNYTGLVTPTSSILGLLFGFSIAIYGLFGLQWGYIIFTSIYYLIGALGIFLLVYELTKNLDRSAAYIASISATIIAIFEFDSHLKTLTSVMIFLPYVVLFTYFIIKNFESKNNNSINLLGLIVSISFLLASGGGSYIIQNLIFLLFFALFIFLIVPKGYYFRFLKYTGLTALLSILINISWIFSTYIFTKNVGNQYFNTGSVNALSILSSKSITALMGFGSISSNLSGIVLLSIFLIAVIGFLKALKNKVKLRLEFGISLALLFIYLIFVIFGTGINKPFGVLFASGVKIIPYLLVFRYTYFATHYILLFAMATLFGVGIAYVIKFAKNNKNKFLSFCIYALIFLILIAYLYSFDYLQISAQSKAIIPGHVFNISDYINLQKGTFSIATLPMASNWQSTTWYSGTNVYSSLIDKPTYTGSYTYYNEIFFPVSTSLYGSNVGSKVDLENTSNISISNGFGIFGIHYIIVQGDALTESPCEFCYISPFSFNTIYSNLNNSKSIYFVKKFSNSSIYENSNYVPLAYGSDLLVPKNITSTDIINIIENNSFNIQNTSIYEGSISGLYNDSNTINATPIANFSKPNISFVENTPTKVTVHVSKAHAPRNPCICLQSIIQGNGIIASLVHVPRIRKAINCNMVMRINFSPVGIECRPMRIVRLT